MRTTRVRPKRTVAGLATAIALLASIVVASGSAAQDDCWPTAVPAGALPGQPPPVLCSIEGSGPSTAVAGDNTWSDDFDHGLSFGEFDESSYRVFDALGDAHASVHWRHADHWMVDLVPDAPGETELDGLSGAMMRPDQTFRFEDGTLVVETTFAAGIPEYQGVRGNVWGEIDITTAAAPTQHGRHGATYGYDYFPGHYSLGCRMQSDSNVTCSLNDDSDETFLSGHRIWEMSWFQHAGTTVFGGNDFVNNGATFEDCAVGEPDSACRSDWRFEFTRTSVRAFINGELYFEQTGIPPLPDELFNGDLYVYASSMAGTHEADTIRYHWDRFAVNPDLATIDPVPPTVLPTTPPTVPPTTPPTTVTPPTLPPTCDLSNAPTGS